MLAKTNTVITLFPVRLVFTISFVRTFFLLISKFNVIIILLRPIFMSNKRHAFPLVVN